MTGAMQTLTAVLAIVAAVGAVLLLATGVVARTAPRTAPRAAELVASVVRWRAPLTFAIATVATLGSLYFSEIADYVPCRLCWFQRIAMYPIALVALVGLVRRDSAVRYSVVPLAAIGAVISSYHVSIEQGWVSDSESCALFGPSCADVWFESFGFITLAMMALAGFVAIIVLNTLPSDRGRTSDERQESP